MDIKTYQDEAAKTNVTKHPLISLLGLAGEVGGLYSVVKKKLRDKPSQTQFRNELAEEIGDLLWYLAAVATHYNINLAEVAEQNLVKANGFFGGSESPFFDERYPEAERFPDRMRVEFSLDQEGRASMFYNGIQLGDSLSDNSHDEDKYRFHDAFHLAFLAHLHWSPVIRRLLKKKRKSVPLVDENEDGARAAIVEEAVAALVFAHAEEAEFFPTVESVPLRLVTLIQKITSKFEVKNCSASSWRQAIHEGAQAFKRLGENGGGVIEVDLNMSLMEVE
ncbi:MazG nucleotide pyrophosphohydrolase domain-containing protein [Agrobacterium sp. CNPSo 3708]|uniref:nucleoside triphosphate pyrophosphohydrolase family protein n=1 Tax=unclassified Agrobacterium TaxID=2632611 RepID=UPI002363BF9E|nr:nucleoside triphosphate pyrophosphohydrolase family protein [Agrobacterium sp. CNPSo 3708]MDD1498725.1 MazG nucleotide pyrophosphohydrolase domain-containing protein [Agrobacterium sp. CNPSo 3708]